MRYYLINVDQRNFALEGEASDYWIETSHAYTSSLIWSQYNNDNFEEKDKLSEEEKQKLERRDYDRYGHNCLGRLNENDTLLMYKNQTGILAVGSVLQSWDEKKHEGLGIYRAQDNRMPDSFNYKISVNWTRLENPIPWNEIANAGYLGLPNRTLINLEDDTGKKLIGGLATNNDMNIEKTNATLDIHNSFRCLIFQGPPGTSKTHEARRLAAKILGFPPDAGDRNSNLVPEERAEFENCEISSWPPEAKARGAWAIVQFHPAYNYEDFVRGIRIETNGNSQVEYHTENRLFGNLCAMAEANKNNNKKFVLIIDEINRAHLAGVLGELIYGLEYRNQPIATPYRINGSNSITIPDNLYIIGTMNTADRSIGHIDYAVRRRFAFIPMLPDLNVITKFYEGKGYSYDQMAKTLFNSVAALFTSNGGLSPDFHADDVQPGHTYFLAKDDVELKAKFIYQVVPLLREYAKDGVIKSHAKLEVNGKKLALDGKEMRRPDELGKWLDEALGNQPWALRKIRREIPPIPGIPARRRSGSS